MHEPKPERIFQTKRIAAMTTIRRPARAAAIVLTLSVLAPPALAQDKLRPEFIEPQKTAKQMRHDYARWTHERARIVKFDVNHVRWGKERRPRGQELVEFDPPFKTNSPDKVELEYFYTYLEQIPVTRRGGTAVQGWQLTDTEIHWRTWWFDTVPADIKRDVALRLSPVGAMPGGQPDLNHQHRLHQRIVMAWKPDPVVGVNLELHEKLRLALWNARNIRDFATQLRTEESLKSWGVPLETWRTAVNTEELQERAQANTDRLAAVMERAKENDRVGRTPRLGVFLINGRYLLETNARDLRRRIRLANWLLRNEMEALRTRRTDRQS